MGILSTVARRIILEAEEKGSLEAPARPTSSSPKRRFTYNGFKYVLYPQEQVVYVVAGPMYKSRQKPLEIRSESKHYRPIMGDYKRYQARQREGLYPDLALGSTDASTGGAVTRLMFGLQNTQWFDSASLGSKKRLSRRVAKAQGEEFDEELEIAVKEFQAFAGLPTDGKIGRDTRDALYVLGNGDETAPKALQKQAAPNAAGTIVTKPEEVLPALRAAGWVTEETLKANPSQQLIVVDGVKQELTLRSLADDRVIMRATCSTGKVGFSNVSGGDHGGTATGLMEIVDKKGDGEPMYTVFVRKEPVIDQSGNKLILGKNEGKSAQVLTRVLVLGGLQDENSNVFDRSIYIHGTNRESELGKPASGGCVRLSNDNVVKLFNLTSVNDLVYVIGTPQSTTPPLTPPGGPRRDALASVPPGVTSGPLTAMQEGKRRRRPLNEASWGEPVLNSIAYITGGILRDSPKGKVPSSLASIPWSTVAISPDGGSGSYLLLQTTSKSNGTTLLAAYTSVKDEVNATGEAQAAAFRRTFPLESSQIYFGSGRFDRQKAYEGLVAGIRREGPRKYAIVQASRTEATGMSTGGVELTAYQKYVAGPAGDVVDAVLDLTGIGADVATAFPPAAPIAQAASFAISAGQIASKLAKGQWIGLLCDIIGLVPAVGKTFETAGKTAAKWIQAVPNAVPLTVLKSLDDVTSAILASFFKSGASSAAALIARAGEIKQLVKDMSTRDLSSIAKVGLSVLNKYGVSGVIVMILLAIGKTTSEASSAISGVSQALTDLRSKMSGPLRSAKTASA